MLNHMPLLFSDAEADETDEADEASAFDDALFTKLSWPTPPPFPTFSDEFILVII